MSKGNSRPKRDVDREKIQRKNQEKKKALNIRKRRNQKNDMKNGKA